jgi:5-methylcytosine-specific restriction enzyme subunit McrC
MTIPIRNLYYLFSYAWEHFPEGGAVEVGVDDCPDLPNLFARLLVNGTNRLLRRGLDRGYRSFVEETRAPRGKMVLDAIIKGQTLRRGAVVCAFDELTVDVLHNQLVKATALQLAKAKGLSRGLAHELRLLGRRMDGVSDIRPQSSLFPRVQLSRNTGQYGPLLKLCEIIVRNLLPEEDGDVSRFASILDDGPQMSTVFEEFLRSFYRLEQSRFHSVGVETLKWDGYSVTDAGGAHLPGMITDITLRSRDRTVVIDAKFYREALVGGYGAPKVHSGNLYQMLAYLQHTAKATMTPVDGILIYPLNGAPLRLHYRLLGFDVQVVTVDLTEPWPAIHDQLLNLLSFDPASASSGVLAA